MCKGTKAGTRRLDSSADLKRLRLEAGNLRSPSQLSRSEMVATWLRTERKMPERDQFQRFQGGRVGKTWLLIECQAETGRSLKLGLLLVSGIWTEVDAPSEMGVSGGEQVYMEERMSSLLDTWGLIRLREGPL